MPKHKDSEFWWKNPVGFANGVMGAPAGPAMVGEKGPELIEIPGLGEMVRGQGGPEQVTLPEGANVMPIDQMMLMAQIREAAARGGPGFAPPGGVAGAGQPYGGMATTAQHAYGNRMIYEADRSPGGFGGVPPESYAAMDAASEAREARGRMGASQYAGQAPSFAPLGGQPSRGAHVSTAAHSQMSRYWPDEAENPELRAKALEAVKAAIAASIAARPPMTPMVENPADDPYAPFRALTGQTLPEPEGR